MAGMLKMQSIDLLPAADDLFAGEGLGFPAYSWRPQSPKAGREGYTSTVCRLLNHLLVLAKDCQDIQE